MGSAGRSHPARHPRAPGCAPVRRGRAGGPASGQPPGGVPAPQGAEGDRPRRRRGGRDPAHLPAQPRRRAGAAGPTGHVLEPGPGGLRSRDRRLHGGRDMTQAADTVVRKEIVVAAPIERAFSVFTDRFGDFKPPEHNLLAAPIAETIFEPRVGGHIYDRAEDGSECRWARILAYEPPTRVVFSWDIGPTWQLEADPANASEVEVRFVADGPARTRVELEHRHIDRHGPGWEAVHDGIDGDAGWPLYLTRYAALLSP